jgi:hypothetical protein
LAAAPGECGAKISRKNPTVNEKVGKIRQIPKIVLSSPSGMVPGREFQMTDWIFDTSVWPASLRGEEAGAPGIGITPAMIDAGLGEFYQFEPRTEFASDLMLEIYTAMERCKVNP